MKASAINKIVMLGGPKAHAIKSWPVAHGLRPMDHGPWARQGPWAHGPIGCALAAIIKFANM